METFPARAFTSLIVLAAAKFRSKKKKRKNPSPISFEIHLANHPVYNLSKNQYYYYRGKNEGNPQATLPSSPSTRLQEETRPPLIVEITKEVPSVPFPSARSCSPRYSIGSRRSRRCRSYRARRAEGATAAPRQQFRRDKSGRRVFCTAFPRPTFPRFNKQPRDGNLAWRRRGEGRAAERLIESASCRGQMAPLRRFDSRFSFTRGEV